jgi:hypothetical protein
VPKDFVANLEYRKRIRQWAAESEENRRDLWIACARDILFWTNTFVWTYDPRLEWEGGKWLPFNTYPFQDEAILTIQDCVGKEDLGIDKSRDQGASWMMLLVFDHFFTFHAGYSFLVGSRKEDLVDKAGDHDCLFWKIDQIHARVPPWLRPNMRPGLDRQALMFNNRELGCNIVGSSTTKDLSRGGRRSAVAIDEYAAYEPPASYEVLSATQFVTRSRIFNSTPKGCVGGFHDVMHKLAIRKLHFDWFNHPVQRQGLYTTQAGRLKLVDPGFWSFATVGLIRRLAPLIGKKIKATKDTPARDVYPFILDGEVRSPYFDNECERTPVKSIIAQELKRDYLGAGGQFFDAAEIARMAASSAVIAPFQVGELDFDATTYQPTRFVADRRAGRFTLSASMYQPAPELPTPAFPSSSEGRVNRSRNS